MISLPASKLKEILVKQGIVTPEVFDTFLEEAQHKRQNIVEILISEGLVTKDFFLSAVAKSLGVERISLNMAAIDEKLLQLLPQDVARRRRAIVFGKEPDGKFDIAMEDPTDLEAIDFLTLRLSGPVRPYLATDEDLNRAFTLYEKKLTLDFKKVIEDSIRESLKEKSKGNLTEAASDFPIVAIVDNLLAYAVSSRASDIHFEVLDDAILIRFRIDGILHEIIRMPKEILPAVIARIKILGSLRVDEHTHPQDGRFRYKLDQNLIDVRISVIPTFYGEKVELRLLPAAQKPLSLEELGMAEETIRVVKSAIGKSYGMVLACGPTGAGKTTTLYSIINILNKPEVNIITIEDPIEYDMRYINQVQVNTAAGITFAGGLRSILRQDPNIIMVGEIRDGETANIAVQAALTGHLMLSSLHTNDAATAIPRLMDMGVPPFLVAAVLNSVSSQRLARKVHTECIESYVPEPAIVASIKKYLIESGVDSHKIKIPKTFYRGRGCAIDNGTGYLGRVGIFETIEITEKMRKLIIDPQFSLDKFNKAAKEEGMVSMLEDGLRKVERGMTTIDELFRVIRE